LFASPLHEVVRLHASSGTTGKPIVVAYTKEDVGRLDHHADGANAGRLTGSASRDTVQNAYATGFSRRLGFHYGAEGLGATVIPISGGNTDRQIMINAGFPCHRHLLYSELLSYT